MHRFYEMPVEEARQQWPEVVRATACDHPFFNVGDGRPGPLDHRYLWEESGMCAMRIVTTCPIGQLSLIGCDPALMRFGAARKAVARAFAETPALRRLDAATDDADRVSTEYLKRLGFEREGILREQVRFRGHWVDVAVWGLVR